MCEFRWIARVRVLASGVCGLRKKRLVLLVAAVQLDECGRIFSVRGTEESDWRVGIRRFFYSISLAELETSEGIGLVGPQEVMAVVMASIWKQAGMFFCWRKLMRIQEL